jgi:pilus assembly protein CpaB
VNRTTRTVIVMGIATLCAGVAAVGVYAVVSRTPPVTVEAETVPVVVAAKPLPTGRRLADDDVKLVRWPSGSPPPEAFARVEEVVSRGLVSSMVQNEPITKAKLAPLEAGAGLPPTIPSGMRAMSVRVDEVVGVAGFVLPGTRVDVIVTVRETPDRREPMSRTVVSNVLVLTAGTRIDQEEARSGEPRPSTVVTLAVTPTDVEKIALGAAEGQLSLALRNPLDAAPTATSGIRVGPMMEGQAVPAPAPAPRASPATRFVAAVAAKVADASPPAPDPPRVHTVVTIRAMKLTEEVIR